MQEAQNNSSNSSLPTTHIKSFWLYVTIGTLAFLVGVFVIWQVYNFNLDEEIEASAYIKTRIIEKKIPAVSPVQQPAGAKPAGQK